MADDTPATPRDIAPITIETEMKRSYLDYAMSVIVARALPDVRDGLKPVHRRILYSMRESGFTSDKAYRKSARIVGEVLGKYHPHGNEAVYDAMVRMAQDFAMRLPLLDGQGNFGSMDGDPAAAMRYTEIRMGKSAEALLTDIDKDTVDFQPNYDETTSEPMVLPAEYPNLLVNGAGGIAVGMATNIPPHNLGEVVDACLALVDDPELPIERLMEIVPGPDFPTGALILGKAGIRNAFTTGRGSLLLRGKHHIETLARDREAIIIDQIPYQVNKASMVEKIADAVRAKKIEGISDLRDESDRQGVRVVVEVKRDAVTDVVLNQLYRHSPLQTSFGVNMLALNAGRPEQMNLKQILQAFVAFREEVIARRTRYLLEKARERGHVLVGLAIAVANIDEVIALIRGSKTPQEAREKLLERHWPAHDVADMIALIDDPSHRIEGGMFRLSEAQARAILDLRLNRLTALGREEIEGELTELATKIREYLRILGDRAVLLELMRAELTEIRARFATPRRTEIVENFGDVDDEDLIQREDMVVTVSHAGYVKRVPLSTYRPQRRGGRGRSGMSTRDEDFVAKVFVASTHTPLLLFSSFGRAYMLKVYRLPQGTPQSRGKAFQNLLRLADGEFINTVMPLPEDEESWGNLTVMFATARGMVRRNSLNDFTRLNALGKYAMKFDDGEAGEDGEETGGSGDRLVGVATCTEDDDILLASRDGKCIRFQVGDVRVFQSNTSLGVRGMKLQGEDRVVTMSVLRHAPVDMTERDAYLRYASAQRSIREGEQGVEVPSEISADRATALGAGEQFILTITENGFGKRTSAYEYRVTGRGGQGIINIETSTRNGPVVGSFPVEDTDQIVAVTNGGQLIRFPVDDIRIAGRNTQGVTLFRTAEDEQVVSIARLDDIEGDEELEPEEGNGDEGADDPSGGDAPGSDDPGPDDGGTGH
ncbi:MAG: DNA gyrase subunit A [Sneathiellaceae bacterium]